MTTLLTGGIVVTSLAPPALAHGDVLIDQGRIARTGRALEAEGAERIDCTGCLVVPGNVCSHTHLYSALARGMPYGLEPPRSFVQILQRVWWRLDRALDLDAIRVSALVAGVDALLAGTTTVVDHHASPNAIDGSLDVIAGALAGLGIRSVLCYESTDRDGPERARAGVAENARFLGRVAAGDFPLSRGMVGAHASFTLSDATLEACVDAAAAAGTGIHVHVAEDEADESDAQARFGVRVVERLATAGAMSERALLAHAVHLDEAETDLVRSFGACVAANARSNMHNRVGRADLRWLDDHVALGTDGIGADMFEEGRVAWLRAHEADPHVDGAWLPARLARGARLAGALFDEPLLGRIEPGAPADLLVLDCPPPTPLDSGNLADHWALALSSACVRDVLVAGRAVVRERALPGFDRAEIAALGREQARSLWDRVDAIGAHPFTPAR
jgi:putative selenium metabolism protein SsnA